MFVAGVFADRIGWMNDLFQRLSRRLAHASTLRWLGVMVWGVIFGAGYVGFQPVGDSGSAGRRGSLMGYMIGGTSHVDAIDPTSRLQRGDPLFMADPAGEWLQVGHVEFASPILSTSPESWRRDAGQRLRVAWYATDHEPRETRWVQYRSGSRLEDVIAVMLPAEQREQIAQRLTDAMSEHGEQLSAAYMPLVQLSFQRSLPIIEEEFRRSVARHRDEVDALLSRWNDQVMQERLIPLARREILPIVRQHGEPEAEKIGRELWDKASLWRFGWRAVYDRSPLPKKDLLQEEWDRFVQEQAIPVFESHMDDIAVAVQQIVMDVAKNQAIRSELSEVATQMVSDPSTRVLVRSILKETFVDNARLRQVWTEVWTSDEVRQAFSITGERLEPIARQIGDDLFGTREGGINPNFARVLRNQILGKDRRWIVATRRDLDPTATAKPNAGSSGTDREVRMVIEASDEMMPYPMVYMAGESGRPE